MKKSFGSCRLWGVGLLLLLLTGCRQAKTGAAQALPTPEATATPAPAPTATVSPSPAPTDTPVPTATPCAGPVLELLGEAEMTLAASFTFEDPGCRAADEAGHALSENIRVEGEVIPYVPGTYTLTYTVADEEGREASVTRTVTVEAVPVPDIVEPAPKTVYLTFDDGPCGNTGRLLDVLKKHDAKATFFVVGNKASPEFIKRAYEEGHSIGVHSYTHVYKDIYASEEAFFRDFLATEQVIYEQTGSYTRLFRFPGGSSNTCSMFNRGIISRLAQHMQNMGFRYFDWNVSSGDCGEGATTDTVYKNVTGGISSHADSFSIVLQHDIRGFSVAAVERILVWGEEHGYTFLPLTLDSPEIHSKIRN